MLAARGTDGIFIGGHICVPVTSFDIIRLGDLPVVVRIVQALRKPGKLFLFANMKEKLQNPRTIIGKSLLKITNPQIAGLPNRLVDYFMHPRYQNIFIMRAIEDCDLTSCRSVGMDATKKNVARLFYRWPVEAINSRTLRIENGYHVIDLSVFAPRVHSLQNDENGSFLLRVE